MIDCVCVGFNTRANCYDDSTLNSIDVLTHYNNGDKWVTLLDESNEYLQKKGISQLHPQCRVMNPAIMVLASTLIGNGLSCEWVNLFQDEKDELRRKLESGVRVVAITTTLYFSPEPIKEIVDFVRLYDKEVLIVLGGAYVYTLMRAGLLDSLKSVGANVIIASSQGELELVEIVKAQINKVDIFSLRGLHILCGGEFIFTGEHSPYSTLVDNRIDYKLFDGKLGDYVFIRTTVGCPFNCYFCSYKITETQEGKYLTISEEQVEDELDRIASVDSVEFIEFIDSSANIPIKRFKNILRMMIKNKYRFKWGTQIRCQFVDEEMAYLMKEAGCIIAFLGIESGSNTMLGIMNKKATTEKYTRGINFLREAGIFTIGSFIIGFPGETDETLAETAEFINRSNMDIYFVYPWELQDLAPIFKLKDKYGIRGDRLTWQHNTMNFGQALLKSRELICNIDNGRTFYFPFLDGGYYDFYYLAMMYGKGLKYSEIKEVLSKFDEGLKKKLRMLLGR